MSQEHENPFPTDLEAAFQSDVLRQARRRERRSAVVMCICCVVIVTSTILLLGTRLLTHSSLPLQVLLMLGLITLTGVIGLGTSIKELRDHASN